MSFVVSSAVQDDRITRLEAQVAFLAQRLGISAEELKLHESKPVPSEVQDLVNRGRKLEAISVYRDATGASLKSARAVVDQLSSDTRA